MKKDTDAIGIVRLMIADGQVSQETAEKYFPELKENEDERVGKELIAYIKDQQSSFISAPDCRDKYEEQENNKYNSWIAWLERQLKASKVKEAMREVEEKAEAFTKAQMRGEEKSIWHNEDEEPQRGSLILLIMQSGTPIVAKIIESNHTFNHGERWAYIDDLLERQDKQDAIAFNDAHIIDSALNDYCCKQYDALHKENGGVLSFARLQHLAMDIYGWCKKQNEQKPTAWSEEDERMCRCLIEDQEEALDNVNNAHIGHPEIIPDLKEMYNERISWLKSLKDRIGCEVKCTTMWRPSGEQMKYLHKYAEQNNYDGAILTGLYDDLLKAYNLNK